MCAKYFRCSYSLVLSPWFSARSMSISPSCTRSHCLHRPRHPTHLQRPSGRLFPVEWVGKPLENPWSWYQLIGDQWGSEINQLGPLEQVGTGSCVVARPTCIRAHSFTMCCCRPWNLKRICKTGLTSQYRSKSLVIWQEQNASEYILRCPSGFNQCMPWKRAFSRFLRVSWHRWTRMMRQAASMWLPACLFNVEWPIKSFRQ